MANLPGQDLTVAQLADKPRNPTRAKSAQIAMIGTIKNNTVSFPPATKAPGRIRWDL
jgi:hypothetical protein